MTTAANEQIEQLSREELLALVIRQQEIIALLQAGVAALKAELEKFRRPPATSRNSSRPPSLDQKANSDPQKKKRKETEKKAGDILEEPSYQQEDRNGFA